MCQKILLTAFIIFACAAVACAQQLLGLKDAIGLAINQNYNLKVYSDSTKIASANNTIGNAGMLPVVNTTDGLTYGNSNLHQAFAGRPDVIKKGAVSTGKTGNLVVSYNLFDGLRMFATKHRLEELEFISKNSFKVQLESTILQVMTGYYNIVRAIQTQHVTLEAIRIDDERMATAKTKFDVGAGNKIDFLQATVDRNQDQSALMAQQISIDSAKVFLNQLMARDLNTTFEPADTNLIVEFMPSYTQVIDSAVAKNVILKNARLSMRLSEYTLKQVKADLYPQVSGIAGYFYNRSTNTAGFSLYNQSYGPQLGLNLNWNLFNGFNVKRRISNAKISIHATQMQYQNVYTVTLANITAQYKYFQNSLATLELEKQNIKVAHENLDIALAKYRLGASTQIELMTAEQSLVASLNRLVIARYKTKIAESALLRLSGSLVN